ncbi:MAG: phage major capsid protein [Candidatus Paceibacterota bacterium]|jgi:hypothetical protein
MGMQYADVDDAVLLTQQGLVKRGAFVDMQTDLTDHVAVREMWKGKQHKFDGGNPWEFDIQVDHNHSAHAVELYETDTSAINDTMIKGTVQPRHINANYLYDQREPAFQRGGTAIVDLIQTRYTAMMVSLFEYLEAVLWTKPTDSSDEKTPFGIAYWVTKNASEGFNGGDPTGFALGRANITTASQPRWANWTNSYSLVSTEDLIRKMRTMHRRIQFRSVVSHAEPVLGSMKNGIYTNSDTVGLMEELLEAQNTNLGNDLDSQGGRVVFKSSPIIYAPYLDADTTNPVYMLDWNWLAIGVMPGWENQLTAPYMVPGKHLVRRVDLDATLQCVCTNLRRQGVIYKV